MYILPVRPLHFSSLAMLTHIALVTLFAGFCTSQKLVDLSTLKNGDVLSNVPDMVSIFLSSSSNTADLQKLFFVSQNGTMSAYDLTQQRLYSSTTLINNWDVSGKVTVTGTNNGLTGLVYISSPAQARHPRFYVYDVTKPQSIKLTDNSTSLFLNSDITLPTTSFNNWTTTQDYTAYMYLGIPTDAAPPQSTQIFSNPIEINNSKKKFDKVLPFSIIANAFFIKSTGTVQIDIDTQSVQKTNMPLTSTEATGFLMKYNGDAFDVCLDTSNTNSNRNIGMNVVGDENQSVKITTNTQSSTIMPTSIIQNWQGSNLGDSLEISTNGAIGGSFYVQYYAMLKPDNKGTTTQSPSKSGTTQFPNTQSPTKFSTSKIRVTTSSCSVPAFFASILIAIFLYV